MGETSGLRPCRARAERHHYGRRLRSRQAALILPLASSVLPQGWSSLAAVLLALAVLAPAGPWDAQVTQGYRCTPRTLVAASERAPEHSRDSGPAATNRRGLDG